MITIFNGQLLHKGIFLKNKAIVFDDKIRKIIDEDEMEGFSFKKKIDADGKYILPGFIDLHIHGYKGHDTMDGTIDALKTISYKIAENGVTSFLPTTMTMDIISIHKALSSIKTAMTKNNYGAEILGAHLEGPFISTQYKGAQLEGNIVIPNHELINGYEDIIKIITIAPEIEGALEFIEYYTKKYNIKFSVGHSGATYEQTMVSIKKGIKSVTHLFNAMTGLHHRNPGIVGAVLNSDIMCELIADTIHVNPALFSMLAKVKGLDKIMLITDAIMGTGLEDGNYELGGQKVSKKGGKCMLSDGTIAGSTLTLNKAVHNFSNNTVYDLSQIIELATLNQARFLEIEDRKGSLDIGKDADIIIADDKLNVYLTLGKGKVLYENTN